MKVRPTVLASIDILLIGSLDLPAAAQKSKVSPVGTGNLIAM